MKYLFILGRNPELSIAELKAVFGKVEFSENKNAVLVELPEFNEAILDRIGGTIAIGKVVCAIDEIGGIDAYTGSKNKFNYCIWNFSRHSNLVSDELKRKFKQEKLKATEKKISEFMDLQGGKKVWVLNSKRLIDEQYFVFENYFGVITRSTDYSSIEERDMKKPHRRESLSISPRLAKIMINLSCVKKGEILLDSFCGIGVILEEALLQGINVIGIDKDKDAVKCAEENLKWFGFNEENYKLINSDSGKISVENADVLVTEPDLGKILRKIPSKKEALKTMLDFEDLMIRVINNLKKSVGRKIVFTAPLIKTSEQRVSCNLQKIITRTGLKLIEGFPIQEFRNNQIVGREIIVLGK